VKITVVGCSGSFPGPQSAASCYLVEADGYRVAIDLGNGAVGALQRYLDLAALDAVLISHLHPDHCIDLLALYIARTYDPLRTFDKLPVHLPTGGGEHLARAYGKAEPGGLGSSFDFVEWTAGSHRLGPLTVTVALMAHPVETWGMRVEHDGKVLAYSGDTGPCAGLVEAARGADVLLCEATWPHVTEWWDEPPTGIHLSGRQAGEHAAAAGVGRLLITHVPAWFDAQELLAEAKEAFGGPVELVAPDATYEV
jgi:ribonuclease BN (tRNA processing enzyme)